MCNLSRSSRTFIGLTLGAWPSVLTLDTLWQIVYAKKCLALLPGLIVGIHGRWPSLLNQDATFQEIHVSRYIVAQPTYQDMASCIMPRSVCILVLLPGLNVAVHGKTCVLFVCYICTCTVIKSDASHRADISEADCKFSQQSFTVCGWLANR